MRSVEIWGNNKVGNYHGISIFLPDDKKWYYNSTWNSPTSYRNTDFAQDTEWDDFLQTYTDAGGG